MEKEQKILYLRLKIIVGVLRVYSYRSLHNSDFLSAHCCMMRLMATRLDKYQEFVVGGKDCKKRMVIWQEVIQHLKRIMKLYKETPSKKNSIYQHMIFCYFFSKQALKKKK